MFPILLLLVFFLAKSQFVHFHFHLSTFPRFVFPSAHKNIHSYTNTHQTLLVLANINATVETMAKNRGKIIKTKSKPKSKTIGRTSVPQPSVKTALESSLNHPLQQESHNIPAEEKIKEDHPIDDESMPPRGAFPPARRHIDWAEEDIDNLTYEEVRDDINRLPSIPQAAKSLDWPYLMQVKASRIVKSAKPFCMNCRF